MKRWEVLARQVRRTKDIEQLNAEAEAAPDQKLKRSLGVIDLISLGIGAIIGTGIFAVIGTAAAGSAHHLGAGPAVSLSFVITSVACGFCALSYAEFASLVPRAGSAYSYAYATLGELVAWIIGWDLIIEYAVGNVAVAIGWAAYFHQLCAGLGLSIPAWLSVDYRSAHEAGLAVAAAGGQVGPDQALYYAAWLHHPTILGVPLIFNLLAVLIVAAITWVLVIGIKESARTNNIMVAVKLVILLFFIAVGAQYVKPVNWSPFMPNGFAGVWTGASLIFFAFIGFDAISTVAEECRNPGRDLPIGIIGSLVVSTVVYVAIAAVLTGIEPWRHLGVADPLAAVLAHAGLNRAAGIVSLGAVISMTSVLLVFQLGQPRIFFAMSRDGLLPAYFAKVHPRYRTPHVTTIWTGVAVAAVAAVTNINEMVELTNIGTLFAFALVNAGVIILRFTAPNHPRVFKTPAVPLVPLCGIAMCAYLMAGLPWITWIRFGAWLVIGLVLYLSYGARHSLLKPRSA
ncbi:MAG: amino acid permease [Candidatus Omnitrophica bacterium]|nr:amino acid permease [Candidatus Omnitrophota bacterium]